MKPSSSPSPPPPRSFLDGLFNKPWILIVIGFVILVSVWVFFFVAASRNQPVIILEESSLHGGGLSKGTETKDLT